MHKTRKFRIFLRPNQFKFNSLQAFQIGKMQQEKQLPKIAKVALKIFYNIEAKVQSYPFIINLCQVGQLLTIMTYIIINSIGPGVLFSQQWFNLLVIFTLSQNIGESILTLIILGDILIRIAMFIVNYILFNQLGTLKKYKTIIEVSYLIFSMLSYMAEIGYYLIGLYLFQRIMMSSSSSNWTIMFLCVGSLGYLIQSITLIDNRLFKSFSPVIAPLLIVFSINWGVLLLLVISTVVLYQEQQLFKKLLYILAWLTCFLCFLQLNYSPDGQFYLNFINLLLVAACCVGVFFFYPAQISRSVLEDDRMLLQKVKSKKNREESSRQENEQLNLDEEEMYEKYLQEVEHLQQVCLPLHVRNMPFHKWNKDTMEDLLWNKVKWDKEKHPSFDMTLFYFSTGVQLKKDVLLIIKEMGSYFQENKTTYNLGKNYKMYRESHQIFKSYQNDHKNDEILQISDVIDAEQNYHRFHIVIKQLLIEVALYWKDLADNRFQVGPEAEDKIQLIVKLHAELQQRIKQLEGYPIPNERLLFELVSKLINNYHSSENFRFEDRIEHSNTFQYLVLEGESIEKVSLKLLRSMHYEREQLENRSVRCLIPNHFHLYLQEIYTGFLEREEHNSFALPLLHSSGCFIVVKCMLYMLPSSGSGVRLLLSLSRDEQETSQLFLYNTNRQRIQLLNEGMRELMGVPIYKIHKLARGELTLFGTDFFVSELCQQQVSELKKDNVLKTKIVAKNFYLKKNYSYNYNNEVALHFEMEFQFRQYSYIVIKVVSESYKKFKNQNKQRTQLQILTVEKKNSKHEEFQNERFFCRIENPYKSKIIQKLNNIRNRSYKSYFYQTSLLKVLLFVMIIGNITLFKTFSDNALTQMSTNAQTMYNLNHEYISLLRLYSNGYSNQLFIRNPLATKTFLNETFFLVTPVDNTLDNAVANLTNYYETQNNMSSQEIKLTYLQSKDLSGYSDKNYQLDFSNFSIVSNTQFSTFYDFIVAVSEGFNDGSYLPFFVSNYNSILSIMLVYEQYLKFSQKFNSGYVSAHIAVYLFTGLVGLLALYGFAITYKMILLHADLKRLYTFIDFNDVARVDTELEKIKAVIGATEQGDNHDTLYNSKEQLIKNQSISESSQQIQKNSSKNQTKQAVNNSCKKNIQKTCKFTLFTPIIMAFTAVVIYFENINMASDQADFLSILTLLHKYQQNEMWIERYYLGLFQPTYYQQLFGNYINPYEDNSIIKIHFFSDDIPSNFQWDANKEDNLCSSIYLGNITIPFFSLNQSLQACASIQAGVLLNGYCQSLEMLESTIRTEKKNDFSSYLSPNGKSTVNNLVNIIYTRQVLSNYLKVKQNKFFSDFEEYKTESQIQDTNLIGYTMCIALGVSIVLAYSVRRLNRLMNIAIDLICIIPASAMFNIRMTNFIRKEDILSKIDRL